MARKPTKQQQYKNKNAYLAEHFEQVTPMEFYRDMFPEGWLEREGHPEDNKPNAIFGVAFTKSEPPAEGDEPKSFKELFEAELQRAYDEYCPTVLEPISFAKFRKEHARDIRYELHKKHKPRYLINKLLFDDLKGLKDVLKTPGAEFVITSPVTYSGRNRKSANAYHLWGIAIDLDGVTIPKLENLHYQIQNKVLPCPTYLVNSGTGLHVYYLFEEPIPLYNYLREPLNLLKRGLTEIVWNAYTSEIPPEEKQYQGIFQGFRCPGSQTKLGKRYPATAFRVGKKGMLLDLNSFVSETYRVNYNELTHLTLDEAKEKYPDWYRRRIIEKETRGRYVLNRAVYDKWVERVKEGAFDGNRYWCVAMMAINAIKCNVEYEEVFADAMALLPYFNTLNKSEEDAFTAADVYDALDFYEDSFVFYPVAAMEAHTKITLPRPKRNYRKQEVHLKRITVLRDADYPDGSWRNKNGRPKGSKNKENKAHDKVREWRKNNPGGSKYRCIQETGLSKPTVYKWWNRIILPKECFIDDGEKNIFTFHGDEHDKISWQPIEKKG